MFSDDDIAEIFEEAQGYSSNRIDYSEWSGFRIGGRKSKKKPKPQAQQARQTVSLADPRLERRRQYEVHRAWRRRVTAELKAQRAARQLAANQNPRPRALRADVGPVQR